MHQRRQESLQDARILGSERRRHHTGVEYVGGDLGAPEPGGKFVGEQDVRQLGLVVGPLP